MGQIDRVVVMIQTIGMKELNFQEQAFKALYLESFNAPESARNAGYAPSVARTCAWSWVSITGCPANKMHLRDAIQADIARIYGEENIDAGWVLKRAKMIADFNISKFLVISEHGDAAYDFSGATRDDWYCIEEYTTEQSYRAAAGGAPVPVDKMKIKTASKLKALELVGKHVNVQAFKEQVELTGAVAVELTRTVVDP